MTTRVSSKGQIVLPAELREKDGIKPGQQFDVQRIERGEYRLVMQDPPHNVGLVDWLLACPVKGYFCADRIRVNGYTVIYLVDANVLSEATKPRPAVNVVEWLSVNEQQIAVDPIILGEIRFGIHLMPSGNRRRRLERWFSEGIEKIYCLSWQAATGLRWARLLADLRVKGKSMPIKDSMIAATALVHGLTIVTRNARDFINAGVKVIDPFSHT